MKTSKKGIEFIKLHEGRVLTCYLDPINIPTIGYGFTNRSPVVTEMLGKLIPGKTKITQAQCDQVLAAVIAREIDPIVTRHMPGAQQHEHDAGASGSYNLGAERFMGYQWANLWRQGRKREAARHLAANYNTAGGKPLPGLVRRRKEEAALLEHGIYAGVEYGAERIPAKGPSPQIKEAQEQLAKEGFDPGTADGFIGPKTERAVRAYQARHPHLTVDGKLGPATIAQLKRDAEAAGTLIKDLAVKVAPAAGGAGFLATLADLPWHIIVPLIVVAGAVFVAWKYRDVWQRKLSGKPA